jgi:hypothetical protein
VLSGFVFQESAVTTLEVIYPGVPTLPPKPATGTRPLSGPVNWGGFALDCKKPPARDRDAP